MTEWNIYSRSNLYKVHREGDQFCAYLLEGDKTPKLEIRSKHMIGILSHLCDSLDEISADLNVRPK